MNKIIILYLLLFSYTLSKGKELLDVEIINLRNQRYALTSKIKSSDYKLPFTKIIYNSNGIINIKKFTEEKNGSFKSYIENKNYDSTELKEILKNVFDKNFSNKKLLKKNSEVAELLEKIFEIKFTKSDKKSRPLLLGKSIKYFYANIEEIYISNLLNKMYRILYLQSEERKEEETWDSFLEKLIKE